MMLRSTALPHLSSAYRKLYRTQQTALILHARHSRNTKFCSGNVWTQSYSVIKNANVAPTAEYKRVLPTEVHDRLQLEKRVIMHLRADADPLPMFETIYSNYAPLYRQFPQLKEACEAVWKRCVDIDRFDAEVIETHTVYYDYAVKILEQEAVSCCVCNTRYELAICIHEHRQEFIKQMSLIDVVDKKSASLQNAYIALHMRSYNSYLMSAYDGVNNYNEAIRIYDSYVDKGRIPAAGMVTMKLRVLLRLKQNEQAWMFYKHVCEKDLPINVHFFRNAIFLCMLRRNGDEAIRIIHQMNEKEYELRERDYTLAIYAISLDDEEVCKPIKIKSNDTKSKQKHNSLVQWAETFCEVLQRVQLQKDHPEKYEVALKYASHVIQIYDQMIDITKTPDEKVFPKAIRAAFLLQDHDKVLAIAKDYQAKKIQTSSYAIDDFIFHAKILSLLLKNEVSEALQISLTISKAKDDKRWEFTKLRCVWNVLDYLSSHYSKPQEHVLLFDVLDELYERNQLSCIPNRLKKDIIYALGNKTTQVSDEQVLAITGNKKYFQDNVFSIYDSSIMYQHFIEGCVFGGRFEVAREILSDYLFVQGIRKISSKAFEKLFEEYLARNDFKFIQQTFEKSLQDRVFEGIEVKLAILALQAYLRCGNEHEYEKTIRLLAKHINAHLPSLESADAIKIPSEIIEVLGDNE